MGKLTPLEAHINVFVKTQNIKTSLCHLDNANIWSNLRNMEIINRFPHTFWPEIIEFFIKSVIETLVSLKNIVILHWSLRGKTLKVFHY